MANLTVASLAGMLLLVIIAIGLALVGVVNIRGGLRSLSGSATSGQYTGWHKQPGILFGLNNIVFAVLLVWGAGLFLFANSVVKYALLVLIVLTLLFSILLVTRTITSASQAARDFRERRANKE